MADDRDPLAEQIRRVIERAGSDAPGPQVVDRRVDTSVVVGGRAPGPGRGRWLLPAAAALVVLGGASLVVLNRSDDDRRGAADATSTTAEVDTTIANTTEGPATTSEPASPATSDGSSPSVTAGGQIEPAVFDLRLPDEMPTLPIEVLWETTIGSGPGQMGLEQDGCSSCASPWAPLVLRDGTIVVADDVNERWVVVTDGAASATPLAASDTFAGQPVLGPDGWVYAPVLRTPIDTPAAGDSTAVVVVVAVDATAPATPIDEFPLVDATPDVRLVVDDDRLTAGNGTTITTFAVPSSPALVSREDGAIRVDVFGRTFRWTLPPSWLGTTEVLGALPDGTVVLRGADEVIVRMSPDGFGWGSGGGDAGANQARNGGVTLTDRGVVRLVLDAATQRWQVVRHALPQVPGDDAPACTVDDVDVRFGASDGAMGTQYLPLLVTNVSNAACRLADSPTIVALDAADQPLDRVQLADPSTPLTSGPLMNGVLYPGATAVSVLRWSVMCEDNPGGAAGLVPETFTIDVGAGATVRIDNAPGVDLVCGLVVPRFEWADPSWMT